MKRFLSKYVNLRIQREFYRSKWYLIQLTRSSFRLWFYFCRQRLPSGSNQRNTQRSPHPEKCHNYYFNGTQLYTCAFINVLFEIAWHQVSFSKDLFSVLTPFSKCFSPMLDFIWSSLKSPVSVSLISDHYWNISSNYGTQLCTERKLSYILW